MFTGIFIKLFRLSAIIISVNLAVVMMIGANPAFAQTSHFTQTVLTTDVPALTTGNSSTPLVPLDPAKISFQEAASGLASPVYITNAGDGSGRIFVVEQTGYIRILKNGAVLGTPFLDIHTIIKSGGEQGLLALAFHPSYGTNSMFFVAYTAPRNGDATGSNLVLEKFSVSSNNPDLANPNSGVILLTISHPVNTNHNGGTLAFGGDGYLYWSTGDGGSGGDPSNNAQQLNNLLGKLLRIDVNSGAPYGIPTSNPFYSNPDPNVKKEIWAYGLRNPWRISFDGLTHDLYIGDVGQSNREEVDFQLASSTGGENYGWRVMEGSICYNPASGCNQSGKILPVTEYNHTLGCSITSGYVYRGLNFPSLTGYYFYGDYCSGRLFNLYNDPTLGWTSVQLADTPYTLSTFGEDEQGELYLADYGTGKLYNIRYQEAPIVTSSVLANSNPTSAASVNFTVTFSESVTGVDMSGPSFDDFTLTTTGVSGAAMSGVSGSGSVYTVTVNTGIGNGTIRLDVPVSATINDMQGNSLSGLPFINGESYTVNFYAPISMWTTNFNYSHEGWRVESHPRMVADVNGDGKDDLVGFGYAGVWVALSNGASFDPMSMWTTDYSYNQAWRVELHPRMAGDVNGDGSADLVGFGYDGVWVALSNGVDGFDPITMWTTNFNYSIEGWRIEKHPRMVADVNGDGKADLVGFGYNGVWVALSNGAGFDPMSMWTTNFNYSQEGWRVEKHPRMTGDVNGDGSADLVGFGYNGVWVALSDGVDGFDPISMWTTDYSYNQAWRVDMHPRMLADVNGDGKADLAGFGYTGVWVALSNGSGFDPISMWTTDYIYNQGWRVNMHPRMVADINGDGKDDPIGFGYAGVWVAIER